MAESEVVAHIAYDGPALQNGSMDVRQLAPALLAMGELLQNANRVLNADKAKLTVKVQADFKTGSFDFGLLVQGAMAVTSLWGSDTIRTAREIAEFVGLVTGADISLFRLVKWLRGAGADAIKAVDKGDGNIQIQVKGDNNEVNVTLVSKDVYQLATDAACRKQAHDVVLPVHADGIDTFEVRKGKQVIESVKKEDLPSFELPSPQEQPLDPVPEVTQVVEVVKPSFAEDLTWTLSDGSGSRFDAAMKDTAFLGRVKAGEDFRIGDLLRVTIRTIQSVTPQGLRTRREIVEVVEPLKVPRQPELLPPPRFRRTAELPGMARKSRTRGKGRKR